MSESGESNECETFQSTRGGVKLFKNGFTYNGHRSVNDINYWYCEYRTNKLFKCTASQQTTLTDGVHKIIKSNENHNHEPNPGRKQTSDLIENIKSDVSSGAKICKIIQNNKAKAPLDVVENLPSTSALKQRMYRLRKKQEITIEPTDIHFQLDLSQTSIDGEHFVIKDKCFDENKRILIMSTLSLMTTLSNSSYWILDGTFKVAPNIFKQLYTIHGNIFSDNKKTYPLCFCMCTHKDKRTYDVMFELIMQYGNENGIDMTPKVCILDFEKAAISSIKSNFEGVILQGCFFHLGQILNRQIQAHKLTKKYANDIKFNKEVKCLLALSYLPEDEIVIYFNKLFQNIEDPDWKEIAQWFEENYISGSWNRQAKYPPSFWSCHVVNEREIPRTSNSAEAWHRRINILIDKHHPGVYCLIKELKKETSSNIADIEIIMSGAPPEKKKKIYSDKDERIRRILQHKSEYSEVKLLMSIATNLKL